MFNKFCRFFWGETAFLVFTKRKGNLFFYKEKKREREKRKEENFTKRKSEKKRILQREKEKIG